MLALHLLAQRAAESSGGTDVVARVGALVAVAIAACGLVVSFLTVASRTEPADRTSTAKSRAQRRAERARAKQDKRAAKAAARAGREAELARLTAETAGQHLGFRVFKDGTVRKESGSSSSGTSTWMHRRLGLPGPVKIVLARSAVQSASLDDRRFRKPFSRTRDAAYEVTVGIVGGGSNHVGRAMLTIVTNDWVEVVNARSDEDVVALQALHQLLLHVMNVSTAGEITLAKPDVHPAMPVREVRNALRELVELRDEGLLTDAEYEARRQVALSQLPFGTESQADTGASPPSGWHSDPYGTAQLRWWDGHTWTDRTAP